VSQTAGRGGSSDGPRASGPVTPLVFLGASTAFSEIGPLIAAVNARREAPYEIVAVLDDNAALHGTTLDGVPVVGGLARVADYPDAMFVFGIGSFRTRLLRQEILDRIGIADERFATLVHPAAIVYPRVTIGPGCIVHAGVVIGNDSVLESFAIVTFNSVIGPYSRIGRCAMVTSMVTALSRVQIGASAFIGAASCIAEGITIGAGAMLGIATVAARDIEPGAYALGNPARTLYKVDVPERVLNHGAASVAAAATPFQET
jgi:sugar O-acyltransferase (sialic acid O-acetyltransferase NeuD family)